MRSGEEVHALALPGHDDREHTGKRMCPALRAATEGGLTRDDCPTQRAFCGVVGRVNRRVDQPDQQLIEVFLDPLGQLLTLPGSIVFGREAPESLSHLGLDPRPTGPIGVHLFEGQAHVQKRGVQGAMESHTLALRVLPFGVIVRVP